MRNVLVTGAGSPLGLELLVFLQRSKVPAAIYAAGPKERPHRRNGIEHVALGPEHRDVVDFLNKREIDTVIHCGLAPDRSGAHRSAREASVVDTMRLGAAVASDGVPVRSWVVASSSAVYPVGPEAPFLQREDGATGDGEGSFAESVLEAEEYARDVAARAPYLNVALLRLQHLAGDGARSPLSELLRQPVLPWVIGHDPALQLLAIDDAVRALAFAAELELAGVYNAASAGCFRFSEAASLLRKPTLPVLPLGAGPFTGLARRLRLPHVPDDLVDLLRFGHVLDTAKLSAAGFEPDYDQASCLGLL